MTRVSIALDRITVTGRTALEKKIVHILDAQSDPEFNFTEALKRVNCACFSVFRCCAKGCRSA